MAVVLCIPPSVSYGQKWSGRWTRALQNAQQSPKQLETLLHRIQQENIRLQAQNEQIRSFQSALFQQVRPSIFRALPPQNQEALNSFTGTIFQTQYQGQPEVYGVIAMHALKTTPREPGLLSYKFTAVIDRDGKSVQIPAWVVQLSSSKTADIALVKFRQQDQSLFKPLPLSSQEPVSLQPLYMAGYACNIFTRQTLAFDRHTSMGLLQTHIPAVQKTQRAGLCGSPVVNEQGELIGVHVGSHYGQPSYQEMFFETFGLSKPKGDTGYVAPASFLRNLVVSYHQANHKFWPIVLQGQEIARLTAQQYVIRAELLDADQHVIWYQNNLSKMSIRPLQTALQLFPQAHYVRLVIGQAHWQNEGQGWVIAQDETVHRVVFAKLHPTH